MNDTQIVREYYNSQVEGEWGRLEAHPFEFALTKRFIRRYVGSGDKVLDIGGGPGRYSLWLSELGCDVTLLDLSDENVKFAAAKARELSLPLTAVQGDARTADSAVSGIFDAVLLMGPMYHLLEESECAEAVQAALRLLKPGGVFFVSFISLFAGFIFYMKDGPEVLLKDGTEAEYIDSVLANRTWCGSAFTRAAFIAEKDILPFMERFNLEPLHLFGQEGITAPAEKTILSATPEAQARWLDLSEQMCERSELLSYSEHLMYVGRKVAE